MQSPRLPRFKRARGVVPIQITDRDRDIIRLIHRHRLGVVPDRVFGLEFREEDGNADCRYFFLEADPGTMPVTRRNLTQTSFYRKLLA